MADKKEKGVSYLRFGIRTLMLAVAFVAIVMVVGRSLFDWYTSTPLMASINNFNFLAANHPVGMQEPQVTEEEIVSTIRLQLPTLDASDHVKAIFSRIAQTRRLPRGATLDETSGHVASTGERRTVWWVSLSIMTGPKSGYSLRIRENDNPIAADQSKSKSR